MGRIDTALTEAGLEPLTRSAWVEVDTDVLANNARLLAELVSPAELGAVVKADGYGHGLEMAARCAVAGGATWLCVADGGEAGRLRADGYRGHIFVLYPVPASAVDQMARLGVDITVGSTEQAVEMARLQLAERAAVHLEIDTGMTRGGVLGEEAVAAAAALAGAQSCRLAGVWTHFAAPEDKQVTSSQVRRFESTLETLMESGLEPGAVHAAASGGLLTVDTSRHTFTRAGLAFYGVDPGVGSALPEGVEPALSVRAHPVRIAAVPTGTGVGYAGTWTTERPSRIATLPIGYADGWSRSSSPGGTVLVSGQRAPIVGRVSSDAITVDVTDVDEVSRDSEFTLLGASGDEAIDADDVARVRGTISWEVLQQLGARLGRVYVGGGSVTAVRSESAVALETASPLGDYGHG